MSLVIGGGQESLLLTVRRPWETLREFSGIFLRRDVGPLSHANRQSHI